MQIINQNHWIALTQITMSSLNKTTRVLRSFQLILEFATYLTNYKRLPAATYFIFYIYIYIVSVHSRLFLHLLKFLLNMYHIITNNYYLFSERCLLCFIHMSSEKICFQFSYCAKTTITL